MHGYLGTWLVGHIAEIVFKLGGGGHSTAFYTLQHCHFKYRLSRDQVKMTTRTMQYVRDYPSGSNFNCLVRVSAGWPSVANSHNTILLSADTEISWWTPEIMKTAVTDDPLSRSALNSTPGRPYTRSSPCFVPITSIWLSTSNASVVGPLGKPWYVVYKYKEVNIMLHQQLSNY